MQQPPAEDSGITEFEDAFAACFDPGEAAMRRARAEALRSLRAQVSTWAGTQTDHAVRLGITQPRYSKLMRGDEHRFTLDHLVKIAARAGLNMHVTASPAAPDSRPRATRSAS